ncbi:hypothetical protein ACVCH0_20680 [Burkholderia glumae]|uniref:hypothetical protein n=1 Tax=Burkholderia glumae TaxID=337 RepID=UPI0003A90EB5|nr:hypothetical protein [Burkholderia glumae]
MTLLNVTDVLLDPNLMDAGLITADADEIVWQGATYTVANLNDNSHFDRGFVCAKCGLTPLTGAP